ncbi:MAG: YsnF/AvaK domain-containing protein, partial [Chloroflexota bacterium]|nr:YsnF/AvaK domain-containing protein [Chloroflexota bacterium]
MSMQNRGIQSGWEVYTADDEHVGTAREEGPDYLHVHRGRLFGQDEYYFPAWAVGRAANGRAYLTLTRAELEGHNWSVPPRPGETREQRFGVMGTAATDTAMRETDTLATQRLATTGAARESAEVLDQREVVVPVVEERIDITKRPVELGEVVIAREVIEQQQTIPVDVAHEEVRVERRAATREATPDDLRLAAGEGLALLGQQESVIIPLIEEVVEVRKRMMVREELVITKLRVTERHEVTETVRRVEPRIESSGTLERDVDTAATTGMTTGATRTTGTMGTTGTAGMTTGTTGTVGNAGMTRTSGAAGTAGTGGAAGSAQSGPEDRGLLERASD